MWSAFVSDLQRLHPESYEATHCSCENPDSHTTAQKNRYESPLTPLSRALYETINPRQCANELGNARSLQRASHFLSRNSHRGRPREFKKAHRAGAVVGIGLNSGLECRYR